MTSAIVGAIVSPCKQPSKGHDMTDSKQETITLTVYFQREIDTGRVVASSADLSKHGYIMLGAKEVALDMPAKADIYKAKCDALKAYEEKITNEFFQKLAELKQKIDAHRSSKHE